MEPPSTLPALESHLNALVAPNPPPLDISLIETFTASLTSQNAPPLVPTLLPLLTAVLHTPVDPAPVTALLSRLLSPVAFFDLNPSTSDLLSTLNSPSPAVQLLGLSIITKAAATRDEASVFATKYPELVDVLLSMALDQSSTTGVAEAAKSAIVALTSACGYFGDLVWYEFRGGEGEKIEARWIENSVSHARLLGFLQDMSVLDFARVEESGVLKLAMKERADKDVMMQLLQWEFAAAILAKTKKADGAVEWSNEAGIIDRAYQFLEADANVGEENASEDVLQNFLFSKISDFLATLLQRYPEAVTEQQINTIQSSIRRHLTSASSSVPEPHQPTLHLLTSLPAEKVDTSLISSIPLQAEFVPAMAALLAKGGGRVLDIILGRHPNFWEKIVGYGKMQGAKEVAVPALDVIEAVAIGPPTATTNGVNGSATDTTQSSSTTSAHGLQKVLDAPGVLPWLLEDTAAGLGEWEVVQRRREVVEKLAERCTATDVGVALREALRRGGIGEVRPEVATMEL